MPGGHDVRAALGIDRLRIRAAVLNIELQAARVDVLCIMIQPALAHRQEIAAAVLVVIPLLQAECAVAQHGVLVKPVAAVRREEKFLIARYRAALRQKREKFRIRVFQLKDDGRGIRRRDTKRLRIRPLPQHRLRIADAQVFLCIGRARGRIEEPPEGKDIIPRRHALRTIRIGILAVPVAVIPQREGVGQPVLRNVVGLGFPADRLAVRIQPQQTLGHIRQDGQCLRMIRELRIQTIRIVRQHHGEQISRARVLSPAAAARQQKHTGCQHRQGA